MGAFGRRRDGDLLELEEVERRLRPISRRYIGVREIPLERIVGTEGRAGAFTRRFEPRHGLTPTWSRSFSASSSGSSSRRAASQRHTRQPGSASRPALYLELLENLQVHGYHLMRERDLVLSNAEIAADWHARIYSPDLRAIDRDRLGNGYRDAPDADLFLLLHRRRRESFPSCGCPPLEETVAPLSAGGAGRPRRIRRFRGR